MLNRKSTASDDNSNHGKNIKDTVNKDSTRYIEMAAEQFAFLLWQQGIYEKIFNCKISEIH